MHEIYGKNGLDINVIFIEIDLTLNALNAKPMSDLYSLVWLFSPTREVTRCCSSS